MPIPTTDALNSLPVRTENAGDIAAKIGDGTSPTQFLAIDVNGKIGAKLSDGSGTAITSTGAALDVNIKSGSIGLADKSTFTYGTTNELPVGGVFQDTSPSLSAGSTGALRLSANRGLHVNLRDASGNELGAAAASGVFVRPTDGTNSAGFTAAGETKVSVTQPLPAGTNLLGKVGIDQTTPGTTNRVAGNIDQIAGATPSATNYLPTRITNGTTYVDPTQIRALTSTDVVTANIKDATGTAFSAANPLPSAPIVAGAAVSGTNPLPVYLQEAVGTKINNYLASASNIAAGSSDTHQYTVTAAKVLHLTQLKGSASGQVRVDLAIETGVGTGTFTTVYTFFNSVATRNISETFEEAIQVAAGVRVQVTRFNEDKNAFAAYTTIIGHEQ